MKKFSLLALFISLSLAYSCKTSNSVSNNSTSVTKGGTIGKVSFKYKDGGCSPIILITNEDGSETALIPKDKLAPEFDKDGLMINFDYNALRMPQPAGCLTGIPAEITNISIRK